MQRIMMFNRIPMDTWKPWKPVMVKKRLANCNAETSEMSFEKYGARETSGETPSCEGMLPHQKPAWCKCVHSKAWQPINIKPPIMVAIIQPTTSFFELRWPASTANTIVTDLIMRIKVMIPPNTKIGKATGREKGCK